MTIPTDLQILLDGDVLRYEIGFAAETGWQNAEELPPWEYVESMLLSRISNIQAQCNTSKFPIIYLSEGRCFRDRIAKTKPYKGNRLSTKPWHFDNLTVYIRDVLGAIICRGIEADDLLSIDHVASGGSTILVSRDKDLRQVPGWAYSWELGNQPSFGPVEITRDGNLWMADNGNLKGTGLAFFYAQSLIGDPTDNIPGCRGIGPAKAFKLLNDHSPRSQLNSVIGAYRKAYGVHWKRNLLEQGRLLWMTRRMAIDYIGALHPVTWKIGMEE